MYTWKKIRKNLNTMIEKAYLSRFNSNNNEENKVIFYPL